VNLALGEATAGDAQGDLFTGIEWLAGSAGNDQLTGDAGANVLFGREGNDLLQGGDGNDILNGDAGNDTLNGGAGVDVLRGGLGADRFVFLNMGDSGASGELRDRIVDFTGAQLDRIDLSSLDANLTVAGNQAFTFIGGAEFSAPGQVRAFTNGSSTFVLLSADAGLATTELSFLISGTTAPIATDFIL
jgi:Ca2+-binding RTX toxin-like protein